MPILLSQNIPTTIFCATLTTVLLSGKPVIIPTATLLEHALLAQGFMGISKVAFPRRLQLPNRDSTGAKLSNAIKCRCRDKTAFELAGLFVGDSIWHNDGNIIVFMLIGPWER